MVAAEIRQTIGRPLSAACRQRASTQKCQFTRAFTTSSVQQEAAPATDLEQSSFVTATIDLPGTQSYNPVQRARQRRRQLPSSRYKFRPPKYYRGPLHPHQPLPDSDPASRSFIPGPFALPRIKQTYDSTISQDLLTLCYTHIPKGEANSRPPVGTQLRDWVGPSPYFTNRPPRGPRGEPVIRPVNRPTTFRNVAALKKIVVHTMVKEASSENDSAHLHVAGMVIQAITNTRVEAHKARHQVAQWGLKKNKHVSVTSEMQGEQMEHFLSKVVELVLPRIKDYKGVAGSSGDSVGNITFGLSAEDMVLFPEIEVNYDMYPPKMIPGCHITVQTTATTDKEARLLLASLGLPFHGKLVD